MAWLGFEEAREGRGRGEFLSCGLAEKTDYGCVYNVTDTLGDALNRVT